MIKVLILLLLIVEYSYNYLNIYTGNNDSDCLYYFQEKNRNDFYISPYCFQRSNSVLVNNGEKFSFHQLHQLNIKASQLYEWSTPINIIEAYQIYLNFDTTDSIKGMKTFYNCSDLWFGSFCQYTLNSSQKIFANIVDTRFSNKKDFKPMDIIEITNGTCYTHLKCDYILPSPACLDGREICDSKFDCLNGEDEEMCSILEINICEDGFFRCRNGFCIPENLLYDLTESIDCIDSSDGFEPFQSLSSIYNRHSIIFLRDESMCEHPMMFSCGDGTCKSGNLYYEESMHIDNCKNGRDLIYSKLMFENRNNSLSDTCWKASICAFKLQYLFDIVCSTVCVAASCFKKACQPSKFYFPLNPIISNSIRLMYDTNIKSKWQNDITPTHMCYNVTQCKSFLRSNMLIIKEIVCQIYTDFQLKETYDQWRNLFDAIKDIFKACPHFEFENVITNQIKNIDYNDDNIKCSHLSLIHCKGSSKCISKYRFMDGYDDCFNGYDENYNQSCALNLKHYHRDKKQNKCVSVTLMVSENSYPGPTATVLRCEYSTWLFVCDYIVRSDRSLLFNRFCDKIIDFEIDSYGETDETNCPDDWPCLTKYTKCDKYWNCPNGIEEFNCSYRHYNICGVNEHYCKHINKHSIDCININDINTNEIQCLGAIDETSRFN